MWQIPGLVQQQLGLGLVVEVLARAGNARGGIT